MGQTTGDRDRHSFSQLRDQDPPEAPRRRAHRRTEEIREGPPRLDNDIQGVAEIYGGAGKE